MVIIAAGIMTILVGHNWGLLRNPLVVLVTWGIDSTKEKKCPTFTVDGTRVSNLKFGLSFHYRLAPNSLLCNPSVLLPHSTARSSRLTTPCDGPSSSVIPSHPSCA